MSINIGAVAGPLTCGLLAQLYGWHVGFGMAGILMLIALATYSAGYRLLAESVRGKGPAEVAAPLTGAQWRIVAALFGVMALTIFHSIAYYQNNNIGLIWINTYVDLDVLGFHIPVSWFSALDSFVSIVSVPVLFALWRWQSARGGEPGEIAKIATGAYLAAGANLSLAAGSMLFARVPAVFPVLYGVLLGVAIPLSVADPARAGIARRPRTGESHDDGRRVPQSLRRQHHARADRNAL